MNDDPTGRIEELEREVARLRGQLEAGTVSRPSWERYAKGVARRVRSLGARLAGKFSRAASPVPPAPARAPESTGVARFFAEREASSPPQRETHPDVTVVIPVYNSAEWLDDCLSSVLAQTGASLEVICVDDGSTDESPAVLKRYADRDPRLTVLRQPNSGQSVARNRGLEEAAGRYVIFLDSDDFWPSDSLAALVADADAHELDVLLFDCFSFRDGDVPEAAWARYAGYYQRRQEYDRTRSGAEMIVDMRRGRDYRPHVGMYLTRTDLLRESDVSFIPGIVHQDNPFTFALLLRADRTAHRRVDVYARRIRPNSTITGLSDADSAKGYLLSFLSMTDELRNRALRPELMTTLAEVVYGTFDGAHKKFTRLSRAAREDLNGLADSADAHVALQILAKTLPVPPRR